MCFDYKKGPTHKLCVKVEQNMNMPEYYSPHFDAIGFLHQTPILPLEEGVYCTNLERNTSRSTQVMQWNT